MKLNSKVRYGLRTMLDIAEHAGCNSVLQKEIAERQSISLKYLDAIIATLKSQGLVINTAGKSSGYKLTREPSEISVYDIYKAFEQELTLVSCLCDMTTCARSKSCAAKDYWFELNKHLRSLMEASSLEQVMKGTIKFKNKGRIL